MRNFDLAPQQVDHLFKYFPEHESFILTDLIKHSNFPPSEKDNDAIEIMLEKQYKYIIKTGQSGFYFKLTDLGREVKKAGGHFAYLKKLEEKELVDNLRQKLNDEKLKYDVKISKRIFKTYWWTFSFALIALIISLVLGILKVIERLNPISK
ncbi:MAG TPA: hypothetical protein VIJ95_08235 [Hanamia sp.]